MSAQDESSLVKELVSKIQQFLSHQVETNSELNEAAKESLTVATDCIEQAYNIQRKSASKDLIDIYKHHKQADQTTNAASAGAADAGSGPGAFTPDPASLIQNLASTFFSHVAGSSSQQQPQQQQATQSSQPSAPKERKRASEAEKLAAESFKNQGNDLMKQEKFKEAYDCYTQAIDIDNNNAIYYSNRAAASSKLCDHQAALRDCQEAIEIDPNYSKAYGRMGLAYASLDNHQKAKEAYTRAIELDPSNESYRNNLKIAEEKLAEPSGDNNMVNILRSMMTNPEVMSMATRSLQDPRVQNLIGGIIGGVTTNLVGGQTAEGTQNQRNQNNPDRDPPPGYS